MAEPTAFSDPLPSCVALPLTHCAVPLATRPHKKVSAKATVANGTSPSTGMGVLLRCVALPSTPPHWYAPLFGSLALAPLSRTSTASVREPARPPSRITAQNRMGRHSGRLGWDVAMHTLAGARGCTACLKQQRRRRATGMSALQARHLHGVTKPHGVHL